jgi:hypothetical protein
MVGCDAFLPQWFPKAAAVSSDELYTNFDTRTGGASGKASKMA